MKYFNIIKTAGFCLVSGLIISSCSSRINDYSSNNQLPSIFPDYTSVTIPSNIAPLNFYIKEKGKMYQVEVYSKNGDAIIINQSSPKIKIPVKSWHKLLDKNKGNELSIDVFIKKDKWIKFSTIKDTIALESVDNHLVYRLINSAYIYWMKMGIYQRNLENFDEKTIYNNTSSNDGCVNCHSFCMNNPDKMSLHFRKSFPGTVIKDGNKLSKLSTKTKYTMSQFGYSAWHPNGEILAYSVNIINQSFTTDKIKTQDVSDKASDLILYNIRTNTVTTTPKISTKGRENLPTWSPDGKWLYFIDAPEMKETQESRQKIKYDLLRISYDVTSNTFGNVDTVLTSRETGMSITFPSISPDGKYLIFCMTDFGYFTVFHLISDIYILDLSTRKYRKLELNSSSCESYHSWSNNGRWIVFSSKRFDNVYSRSFFSYFDKNGKAHKPFVMPQEDPLFYISFLKNYNKPELVTSEVNLNEREMRDIVQSEPKKVEFDKTVDIDALSGATWIQKHP